MENLLLGLSALIKLLGVELTVLFYSPMIRGFLAGYLVASLVYGFFATGRPKKSEGKKIQ